MSLTADDFKKAAIEWDAKKKMEAEYDAWLATVDTSTALYPIRVGNCHVSFGIFSWEEKYYWQVEGYENEGWLEIGEPLYFAIMQHILTVSGATDINGDVVISPGQSPPARRG